MFARIAGYVESSLFGGRAVVADDWLQGARGLCRFRAARAVEGMSDVAINRAGPGHGGELFRLRTIIILVCVGVAAFAAMLIATAYAPGTTPKGDGSAHALSNSAVGYSGIIRLAQAAGYDTQVIRDTDQLGGRGLTVLTPQTADTQMGEVISRRAQLPTLVVLPKWRTLADKKHSGWVNHLGLLPRSEPYGVLAPNNRLTITRTKSGGRPLLGEGFLSDDIRIAAPRPLQTMTGANLKPLLTDEAGRIVLGQIGDAPLYVLADGDSVQHGPRDAANAESALESARPAQCRGRAAVVRRNLGRARPRA